MFANSIIIENRFMTTFIYIPGGLELTGMGMYFITAFVTIWKWLKHDFW